MLTPIKMSDEIEINSEEYLHFLRYVGGLFSYEERNNHSYFIVNEKRYVEFYQTPPCYHHIMNKKLLAFVSIPNNNKAIKHKEHNKFLKWIMKSRQYGKGFITKTIKDAHSSGIIFDLTQPWSVVWPAMLGSRMLWENMYVIKPYELPDYLPIDYQFLIRFCINKDFSIKPVIHGYAFLPSNVSLKKFMLNDRAEAFSVLSATKEALYQSLFSSFELFRTNETKHLKSKGFLHYLSDDITKPEGNKMSYEDWITYFYEHEELWW